TLASGSSFPRAAASGSRSSRRRTRPLWSPRYPSSATGRWATVFYAGLRRGELRGLRRRDVDLAKGVLHVERAFDPKADLFVAPKSSAGRRRVPIAAVLRAHLRELDHARPLRPPVAGLDRRSDAPPRRLLDADDRDRDRHKRDEVAGNLRLVVVSKPVSGGSVRRGFKSLPLRSTAATRGRSGCRAAHAHAVAVCNKAGDVIAET